VLTILVVSDATGETAERVVRSALVQFEGANTTILRRGHVRTPDEVRDVVREAVAHGALILHTLVSDEMRHTMLEEARLHGIDAMDLIGPVLDRLATRLQLTPQEKPGLFQQLVQARSREIEAVEFAFSHDDGLHSDELHRAEVVLVGVSRTMKTPTMLYLAYRGWFAANVPIIAGLEPPAGLLAVAADRVFCLSMSAARLVELRRSRASHLGRAAGYYASPAHVRDELLHAQRLCAARGWRRIDVTAKSVEEAAREIIALARGPESGPQQRD
jgi:regulator of PEP synthase PpsR (kinase-PPPase family)